MLRTKERPHIYIYAAVFAGYCACIGLLFFVFIQPLTRELERLNQGNLRETLAFSAWGINNILDQQVSLARQIASRTAIREKQAAYLRGEVTLAELVAFSRPKMVDALTAPTGASGETSVFSIARFGPSGERILTVRSQDDITGAQDCARRAAGVWLQHVSRRGSDWVFRYCSVITDPQDGRVGFDLIAMDGDKLSRFIDSFSDSATSYVFADSKGRILFGGNDSASPLSLTVLRDELAGRALRNDRYSVHAHPTQVSDLTLYAIVDQQTVRAPLRRQWRALMIWGPLTLALVAFLLALGLRPMLRRLSEETRLAEGRQLYRDLFRGSRAIMMLVDPASGKIVKANKAAAGFYGYSLDALEGMALTLISLRSADSRALSVEPTARQDQNVFDVQHRLASGEIRDVQAHATPLTWEGRTVLFNIIHDVTERNRLEASLIEARQVAEAATKAKSEFVANMSHELRTPLNAILGFSEVIRDQALGAETAARAPAYAADIHASGTLLLKLIDDMLDLARIEAGRVQLAPEPLDVGTLMADCARLVSQRAANHGLDLVTDAPDASVTLWADDRAARQVLSNLLSNAIKYTPRGGTVILSGQATEDGSVRLAVRDTGIGLSETDLGQLFQPFQRADRVQRMAIQGTGLGLVLVKALADAHGATVSVDSQPDHGSTFAVSFPPQPPAR